MITFLGTNGLWSARESIILQSVNPVPCIVSVGFDFL